MPARTLINFEKNEKQKKKKIATSSTTHNRRGSPPLQLQFTITPTTRILPHLRFFHHQSESKIPRAAKTHSIKQKSPLSRGTTTNRKISCIKREPSTMADAEKRMQAKDATDP